LSPSRISSGSYTRPVKSNLVFFVNFTLDPVDGLSEIVNALDFGSSLGSALSRKGKPSNWPQIPVVLQANAFILGQLVGGDGDEAGVGRDHLQAEIAHGQFAWIEPMDATLFGPLIGGSEFLGRLSRSVVIVYLRCGVGG